MLHVIGVTDYDLESSSVFFETENKREFAPTKYLAKLLSGRKDKRGMNEPSAVNLDFDLNLNSPSNLILSLRVSGSLMTASNRKT